MEETKLATDTLDCESRGREAFCMDRSFCESSSGPYRIEDPAMSSNIVGWERSTNKNINRCTPIQLNGVHYVGFSKHNSR